jgi:hypothetical protein
MRKLLFTCIAATLATAPMASIVKAEDTTIIRRVAMEIRRLSRKGRN